MTHLRGWFLRACAAVGFVGALGGCAVEGTEDEDFDGEEVGQDDAEISLREEAAPKLFATPHASKTQYPIVLAHGFASSPDNIWAFKGVKEELEKTGLHRVFVARVSPFAGTAQRSLELKAFVDGVLQQTGAGKVNIIAHSMGGLDARILVSPKGHGYGDRVASVTTISSPHKGSYAADFGLNLFKSNTVRQMADKLAPVFVVTGNDKKLLETTDVRQALTDISEDNTKTFSARYPDDPRVVALSWAGVSTVGGRKNSKADGACEGGKWGFPTRHSNRTSRLSPLLLAAGPIVGKFKENLPNDGLSTVESAKWGTFLGCIPADHLGDVGGPNKKLTGASRHTGFDHINFYKSIAGDLGFRKL